MKLTPLLFIGAAIGLALLAPRAASLEPKPHRVEPPESDRAVREALAWLKDALTSEEWDRSQIALANMGAKKDVVEAATAYLLLLHPGIHGYDELLAELDTRVRRVALGESPGFGSFGTWINGFASLYLIEEGFRDDPDMAALDALARGMEDRQNMEGGWGHGSSISQEYYPSTLVAASAWALFALGGCGRHGVDVEEAVITDALDLLQSVQARSGGFPYGGPEYLKSIEAGRTSGVVLALAALGRTDSALFENAVRYMRRNVGSIPDGHASPAMHVLFGALATRIAGDAAWADYSESVLKRVAAAQRVDGSFDDIAEMSADSFEFMGGALVNRAYITALYAAALATPRSRLAERFSSKRGTALDLLGLETSNGDAIPSLEKRWSRALPGARHAVLTGEHCGVLGGDGTFTWLAERDGSVEDSSPLSLESASAESTGLERFGSHLILWSQPEEDKLPDSIAEVLRSGGSNARSGSIGCCRLASAKRPFWTTDTPGVLSAVYVGGDGVYVLTQGGSLSVHGFADGAEVRTYPRQKVWINAALAAFGDGRVVVCSESKITALDSSGDILWKGRLRGNRGVTPPSFAALSVRGEYLFSGATDGSVCCRDVETGRLQWEVRLPCAVLKMVTSPEGGLFVMTWDRRVHAVADGRILWTRDTGKGRESVRRPAIRHDGRILWAFAPARERLVALDPETGCVLAELSMPAGTTWQALDGSAVVAGLDRVECFDLPGGR